MSLAIWVLAFVSLLDSSRSSAFELDVEPVFKVVTAETNRSLDDKTVVIQFRGPIVQPMAAELKAIQAELDGKYDEVILDLFSSGGELSHAKKVIASLGELKKKAHLTTYVRQGGWCLSACVLIFAQGDKRVAGNASVWLFHGVCEPMQQRPSPKKTQQFVEILKEAGISSEFLCKLVDAGYLTSSGDYWLSGYELFHIAKANMIQQLLPAWRPGWTIDGGK